MLNKYRILQTIDNQGCSRWYAQKRFLLFWYITDSSHEAEGGFPNISHCEDYIKREVAKNVSSLRTTIHEIKD